jgi:hypothetical protein
LNSSHRLATLVRFANIVRSCSPFGASRTRVTAVPESIRVSCLWMVCRCGRIASNVNHKVPSRLMASLVSLGAHPVWGQTRGAAWELVGLKMTHSRPCACRPRRRTSGGTEGPESVRQRSNLAVLLAHAQCHKWTHALQHVHTPLSSKIAKPSRFTENQSSAVNLAQSLGACCVELLERVRSPLPPNSQGLPSFP